MQSVRSNWKQFLNTPMRFSLGVVGVALAFQVIGITGLGGIFGLRTQTAVAWCASGFLYGLISVVCIGVYRRCTFPAMALFWKMAALGIGLRAVADFSQLAEALFATNIPQMQSTVGSALYLAGNILLMFPLLVYPSVAETRQQRVRVLLDVITVIIAAAAFGWLLLIGPHLSGEISTKQLGIAVAQLIGVLLTIFAALRVVMSRKRPLAKLAVYWGSPALLVLGVTEMLTPMALNTPYMALIYTGRIVTVLLHLVSARVQEFEMERKPDSAAREARRTYSILPYFAVAGVNGLLVFALATRNQLDAGTWGVVVASVVSTGVVVARQLSAFTDNSRLLKRLDENLTELEESYRREQDESRKRQALEVQLRQAQKLEALGKLSGGIAHELNTPLQYVKDNMSFVRDSLNHLTLAVEQCKAIHSASDGTTLISDDIEFAVNEVPKALTDVDSGLSRLSLVISSMRSFSGEGTSGADQLAPCDINSLLNDTMVIAGHELRNIPTVVFEPANLPAVICNARDLNQVWLNLLVNAASAIEGRAGGVDDGKIVVRTLTHESFVTVEIADNGCGMTPDVLERAFDPFFTTKPVGIGSGQGLTVAHSIVVDGHSGTINVESTPDEGTTFRVILPTAAS